MSRRVTSVATDLRPGDHACVPFEDEEEYASFIGAFVGSGLEAGERVVCLVDQDPEDVILHLLRAGNGRIDSALRDGALAIRSVWDTYLEGGSFDPSGAIADIRREDRMAHQHGFRGLRFCGEMSWASRWAPGSESIPEFERALLHDNTDGGSIVACMYDVRRCDPAALRRIQRVHPVQILRPPVAEGRLRIRDQSDPPVLILEGDLDHHTSGSLRIHLGGRLERALDVDLGSLSFCDAAGARVLAEAARSGRRLRLIDPKPVVRRIFTALGWDVIPGVEFVERNRAPGRGEHSNERPRTEHDRSGRRETWAAMR